jgi:uncharacterized protein with GYD domain
MPRYVILLRFTDQGARAIAQSPKRASEFRELAIRDGVEVELQLWTIGGADGVLVLRGDDEEKVLRLIARLEGLGNVRTETLRAFDAVEFARMVG